MIWLWACDQPSTEGCASCDGECRIDHVPATSREHTDGEPVDYPDRPPTSGEHDPCWAEWGVHTEEVPDENWVHNLEHGGVVFLWNCPEGCEEEVAAIGTLVGSLGEGRALASPYGLMESRFAVVAWEWRLLTECHDEASFRAFFDEHVAQAPEVSTADPTLCMDSATTGG